MSESTARPLTGRPPGATQISSRLVSLAILKENWNQGQTYLDNFVPFVVECLRNASSAVTSADVQEGLRSKFRIRVPQGVVETLLHKTVKRGYAYREDNAYTPLPEMLSEVELMAPRQHELLRTYEALSKEMLAFAKERFALDVSEAEASDALDAYVADFGAETILHGCTAEVELRALPEPGLDYVAHSFVENLSRTNPTFFGYFQTLVEGSMLASIVYLPNVESTEQRFRDSTTIYLDTPFVLKALGFVGPEQRAPAVEQTLKGSHSGALSPASAFGADFVLSIADTARIEIIETIPELIAIGESEGSH